MRTQVHVFYSGRVQGVGFRFTAEEAAKRLGVVGWVRNLRDGRVEFIGQADEATLIRLLDDIRQGPMSHFIAEVKVAWSDVSQAFKEFEIRY